MPKRPGPRTLPGINRQKSGFHKSHLRERHEDPQSEEAKKRTEKRNEAAKEKGLSITKVESDEDRWVIRSVKTGRLIIEFWNREGKYMTSDGVTQPCPRSVYRALEIAATLKSQIDG